MLRGAQGRGFYSRPTTTDKNGPEMSWPERCCSRRAGFGGAWCRPDTTPSVSTERKRPTEEATAAGHGRVLCRGGAGTSRKEEKGEEGSRRTAWTATTTSACPDNQRQPETGWPTRPDAAGAQSTRLAMLVAWSPRPGHVLARVCRPGLVPLVTQRSNR